MHSCSEIAGTRRCSSYETLEDDASTQEGRDDLETARKDFAAAGGLAAFSLTFTLLLIILLLVHLACADKPTAPLCGKESKIFSGIFLVTTLVMTIFSIAAAGVAGGSDAVDADLGCDTDETRAAYGVGIMSFLVFFMLAQAALVAMPCGPFAYSGSAAPQGNTEVAKAVTTDERKA